MAQFLLDSLTDSGYNPIELHPGQGFVDRELGRRSQHTALEGNQQVSYWPTRPAWTVPIAWVSSENALRINDWWKTGDELSWTLNTSATPSTALVIIANAGLPLGRYHTTNRDFLQGVLMLEAKNNAAKQEEVFVLDDDIYGLLDQDYNALG